MRRGDGTFISVTEELKEGGKGVDGVPCDAHVGQGKWRSRVNAKHLSGATSPCTLLYSGPRFRLPGPLYCTPSYHLSIVIVKMKLSQSFVSASLAYCFAGVTASDTPLGQVFHVNPVSGQQPSSIPTVDPETARLILAQKLGLAQFHSLSGASRESLDQINEVAGDPANPFLEPISLPEFPALIIIDGVKKPEGMQIFT